MSDFFTGIPTGNMEFPKTTVMMLDLSLLLAAVLLIILSKKYLNFTRFLKIIGILLLFEFFIINIWYWLAPFLVSPWPFYHCRLAKMILPVIVLLDASSKTKPLHIYASLIGFLGAVSAFLIPIPDPFLWPHITIASYFMGHFLLFILSLGIIVQDLKPWTARDFLNSQLILLIANIVLWMSARITKFNYGYFLSPPLFKEQLAGIHPIALAFLVIAAHAILLAICFLFMQLLKKMLRPKLQSSKIY